MAGPHYLFHRRAVIDGLLSLICLAFATLARCTSRLPWSIARSLAKSLDGNLTCIHRYMEFEPLRSDLGGWSHLVDPLQLISLKMRLYNWGYDNAHRPIGAVPYNASPRLATASVERLPNDLPISVSDLSVWLCVVIT